MTVSSTTRRWSFTGDGTTTIFAYDNKIFATTDLKVYQNDTLKTETTHYTVSGAGNEAGGNVTFVTAPANNDEIVIIRDVPKTQATDYPVAGRFPAASTEDALDKLTVLIQQMQEELDRCLKFSVTDTNYTTDIVPQGTSNRAIGYDTDGATLTLIDTTTLNVENLSISNYAGMKALDIPVNNSSVFLAGRTTAGDGGGGQFFFNSSNLVSQVTADTQQGIYVPPNSDTTGASGAWQRRFDGALVDAWFGVTADGSTTESTQLQAAVDYANSQGGNEVQLSAGVIVASINGKTGVSLVGKGFSHYLNSSANAATVLKRPTVAAHTINLNSVDHMSFRDFDLDGNDGEVGGGDGFVANTTNYIELTRVKILRCTEGFKGDSANPAGEIQFTKCVIRNCITGVRQIRDSQFLGCTFSANETGIYLNNGQVRISDCFFEFHRSGNNAGDAISIDRNSSEISITGCQFDRNAGHSIYLASSGVLYPRDINITGNLFKRCAWGEDLPASQCYSVRVNGRVDGITFIGNTLEANNHSASTVYGNYSPIGLIDFGTSTGVVEGSNNTSNNINPFDFNAESTLEFSASGTANEYYLRDTATPDNNPYVIQPDFIEHSGTALTAGTVGSLTTGQYAWADNDSLGFSTLYVRLAADANPNSESVKGIYTYLMIDDDACTSNVMRTHYRDRWTGSVATTATQTFTLKTRDLMPASFSRKAFYLHISGDETSTAADSYFIFPFTLARAGAGAAITVKDGNIQTWETGFTGGWNGAGTTMEVTITAAAIGSEISVSIENTGANRLDLICELRW